MPSERFSKRPRSHKPGGGPGGRPGGKADGNRGAKAANKQPERPAGKPPSLPTRGSSDAKPSRKLAHRPPRKSGGKPEIKPAAGPDEPLRIAKAMARAGLCSRREAERWIDQGRVNVNGRGLTTPAFEVGPKDKVLVDGKHLPTA